MGEWRNTYLKVTMASAGGKEDSTSVMEADSANWADVLHMKPIQTFFDADSTWHSDHYAPNDSLLFIARGNWYVTGDTLVMEVLEPTRATYKLHTAINGGEVKFHSVLDFDEDGVADDDYVGWQRKH
ncbi:MAG: hypothetical protein HC859_16635 [Bacteroidia bacterium]|nr:hypothetical protein [Bacteroidia bacterium]